MTELTLGAAARMCGKGKTTLARMIKRGALSATRTEDGGYRIDASELARAVPFRVPGAGNGATGAAPGAVVHHAPSDATGEALIATLRQVLDDMRQQRDEWKDQAAAWRDQAQRLALTDQRRPWWKRLANSAA
jgi:hypothetical protein